MPILTEQRFYDIYKAIEPICGNCEHWNQDIVVYNMPTDRGFERVSPCKMNAKESPLEDAYIFMPAHGRCCGEFDDCFSPNAEAVAEAIENAQPMHVRYGITPGIDCPL